MTFPVGLELSRSARAYRAGPSVSPFPIDVLVRADGTIAYLSYQFDVEALRNAVEAELP